MRTKTRIICFLLIINLSCFSFPALSYYVIGLSNFQRDNSYTAGLFNDVFEDAWYYSNVVAIYEFGLMNGIGDGKFAPTKELTVSEAITLAERIYSIYFDELSEYETEENDLWYSPYIRAATADRIIAESQFSSYTVPATRAQFAQILANSIDPVDFNAINPVDDGAIPDVPMSAGYADAVYMLYRAGILTGSDSLGTFNPDSTITRAEAAAIITRIVDPTLRKSVDLLGEY